MVEKNRFKNLPFILIMVGLTSYAWRWLPGIVVRADGLIYLLRYFQDRFWQLPFFYTGFETGAFVWGTILSRFFGTQMALYRWTELVVMLIIDILFFLTVLEMVKKRLVAFVIALIFSVNYFGNWDMHTNHCYCFFLERIPNMIFLVPSLLFLHRGLEKNRRRDYLISLGLYFLGVGLAHFAVLFTAPFLFYPFFWKLFYPRKNKKRFQEIINGGLIGLIYLGISGLFVLLQQINESGLTGRHRFFEFLLHPGRYHYFEKMVRQLVHWSQYPMLLLRGIGSPEPLQFVHDSMSAGQITPWIVLIYFLAAVLIFRRLPSQRPMLLTIIFGVTTIFWFNAFFGQYEVMDQPGSSRYLYFPTYLLAIFWGLFLWAAFWLKKSQKIWVGVALLTCYYLVSIWLIDEHFKKVFFWEKSAKTVYHYLIKKMPDYPRGTLAIGPYGEIDSYEVMFFNEQLSRHGQIKLMSSFGPDGKTEMWRDEVGNWERVIRIKYDEDCGCVKEEVIK